MENPDDVDPMAARGVSAAAHDSCQMMEQAEQLYGAAIKQVMILADV